MSESSNIRLAFTWPDGPIPSGVTDLEGTLEEFISKSVRSIDIMAYHHTLKDEFILNKTIESAIREYRPKIRFYTNTESTARILFEKYSQLGSDVEAWYWNHLGIEYSIFHLKTILVNDRHIYIGSANLSTAAMELSAECGIFLTDKKIAMQLKNYISDLIKHERLLKVISA